MFVLKRQGRAPLMYSRTSASDKGHNRNNLRIMDKLWCPNCRHPYRAIIPLNSGHLDKNDWSQQDALLYSGFSLRWNFRIPFGFFRDSVAGGRVKQSPRTLQQLEALATS